MTSRPPLRFLLFAAVLSAAALPAQSREPVHADAVDILKKHGLEKSQVMEHLSWICDVHGPRLTGSPNLRRAQAWAVKTLKEWGLSNAHTEEWGPFGRGWRLDHCSVTVVGENPWPVIAYPKAWCSSLPGRVEGEVLLASQMTREELEKADLSNKIVLMDDPRPINEPFDATAKRFDSTDLLALADQATPQREGAGPGARRESAPRDAAAREGGRRGGPASRPDVPDMRGIIRGGQAGSIVLRKKPLAVFDRGSKGDYGTVFVGGAAAPTPADLPADTPREQRPSARGKGVEVPAQFTLAVEHYNRIYRLLKKGIPVKIALELKTTYFEDDPKDYNVVADIPGTDPVIGKELVMLGAHYDSWQSGTGCTDNGCGSAVVMEATRLITELIKETGKGPRRTIRAALWSGEEQGLLGSRAFVRNHFGERGKEKKSDHALFAGYFNLDNGTGKIRGIYTQGNEDVAPIFRAWLRPFHALGASTVTFNNTGGTDHQAFDGVGLPGFQFIQDPVSYSPRTHHSNMDVWDHAVADDLKQASTIMASFVWHTAQRDEKLPRKPEPAAPASRPEGSGGGGER